MRLTQALEVRQQQTQRIDPRQILASEILTWTTAELEAAVERELAENPALEVKEDVALSSLGDAGVEASSLTLASVEGATPHTLSLTSSSAASLSDSVGGTTDNRDPRLGREDGVGNTAPRTSSSDFGDDDPMDRVASALSLHDHLRAQVGQVAGGRCAHLVRHLIEHVDDRGYLPAELNDFAERERVCPAEVEAAVAALQMMDPPGVGARDLRECLLLQAAYLDQIGEADPLALPLLTRCWDDLAARREARIGARLSATPDAVKRVLAFVQQSLTPYPGSSFRASWESRPRSGGTGIVRPDIVFRRTDAGFLVEVAGDFEGAVLIAPLWQRLADRPESCKDDGMRRYVREHVERAEGFLQGLQRRGRTLRAIAQALAELQQGYLETGNRAFLRPLTRAYLSERLSLDESVISRAVADKFARLPSGEVLPLDAFFGNAHAVREALVTLIDTEDPASPYSDDEIADLLTSQGFPLARRTVAKYRGLEKILPARLRKRA